MPEVNDSSPGSAPYWEYSQNPRQNDQQYGGPGEVVPAPAYQPDLPPRRDIELTRVGGSLPPSSPPRQPGRRWRNYAILVLAVVIAVLVAVIVVILHSAKGGTTASASDSPSVTASGGGSGSGGSGTATSGPSASASPSVSASPSLSASPGPDGSTAVYSGVALTIPPLSGNDQAFVDLLIPEVAVTGDVPEEDLIVGTGGWGSNPPVADLGTAAPSYSACLAALNASPMDLSTQNFVQGHGYCFRLPTDDQGNPIAYVMFTLLTPDPNTGQTNKVEMQATMWTRGGTS